MKSYLKFTFLIVSFLILPNISEAANKYWVGAAAGCDGTWADTDCWAATSNGAGAAGVPTSADDVFFDGVGNGASNSKAGADITINSLDMTGYVNTLTIGNGADINIDGVNVVFKLGAGMTLTATNPSNMAFDFISTSGTVQITTAGVIIPTLILNGSGGTFQLQDTLTTVGSIFRSAGTFDTNGQTVVMTGAAVSIFGSYTGTSSFANLTRTGNAVKTDSLAMNSSVTVTGTLTINGNSSTNRMLVSASTLGTAVTLTAATVSVTNADFRDITGAGAGSWDLSAITGLSGDAGGNSGITFTTATTTYWTGNSGSWSDATQWCMGSGICADGSGNSRVPLPQDNVTFDNGSFSGTSQTVTLDMPRAGKSIDWSGYNEGQSPLWSKPSATTSYGSLTLVSGMTNSGSSSWTFEGRGSFTLTTTGISWTTGTIIAMVGGTMTLQDSFTSAAGLTMQNGTFNANNFNVTVSTFLSTAAVTRTITMGSGTWTVTTTGSSWNISSTGTLTLNANTSTIVVSNTTATAKTFAGASLTYNNVIFSGDNITVTGSNTFNNMAVNNAGDFNTNGLILTTGTATTTITTLTTNATTTADRAILKSSTSGTIAGLQSNSGANICVDYMSIQDIRAYGTATFYAGANSLNVSGNLGWSFTACPSVATTPRSELKGQMILQGQTLIQ